jgi:hypothetical protein
MLHHCELFENFLMANLEFLNVGDQVLTVDSVFGSSRSEELDLAVGFPVRA